jgi:TP901 family phage tail tape measure protein
MAEAGAAAEEADGKFASVMAGVAKLGAAMGLAALGIGAVSVKLATDFQASMTQLSTEAGVPKAALAGLSNDVLNLAGQVGFGPNSLAQALYHVESSFQSLGITGPQAMNILKTAAEGAKIGGANLTDVTNALDAAISSGIPGVQNYQQAMGALLKIVGSGDMTMQDFADAASTGILATAKVYGNSLTDVGAALATFGDNNIRGQNAATDLKMSIMDLTKQSSTGQAALAKIGITAGQLGKDMQTGGLNKAVTDLHDHLVAAGDGGANMGLVLEDAFTKKSSAPLAILLSQFDRFKSKYPDITSGASGFASAWQQTQSTFKQQVSEITSGAEALGVRIGEALIPALQKVIVGVQELVKWVEQHRQGIDRLGESLKKGAIDLYNALKPAIGTVVIMVKDLVSWVEQHRKGLEQLGIVIGAVVIIAVKGLVLAFRLLWDTLHATFIVIGNVWDFFKKVPGAITDAFNSVAGFFEGLGDDIAGWFQAALDFVEGLPDQFVNAIDDIGSAIASTVSGWFDAVVGALKFFVSIPGKIYDFVVSQGGLIGIGKKIMGVLLGGIEDGANAIWNWLKALPQTLLGYVSTAWTWLGQTGRDVISGFLDGITTAANDVWNWLKALPGRLLGYVSTAYEWLGQTGRDIISGLWNGLVSAYRTVKSWFANIPGDLAGVLSGIGSWFLNIGDSIVTGIINGMGNIAKRIGDKLKDGLKNVASDAYKFIEGGSPSKLFARTIGDSIGTGVALGITNSIGEVHKSMANLVTGMTKFSQQPIGLGVNVGASGVSGLAGAGVAGLAGVVGGSGGTTTVLNVTVQGSVIDSQGLFKAVQTVALQHGSRNSQTWQAFKR